MLKSTQIIAKIYYFGILGVVYFQVRNFGGKVGIFLGSAEKKFQRAYLSMLRVPRAYWSLQLKTRQKCPKNAHHETILQLQDPPGCIYRVKSLPP